jgi:hypothetical protein
LNLTTLPRELASDSRPTAKVPEDVEATSVEEISAAEVVAVSKADNREVVAATAATSVVKKVTLHANALPVVKINVSSVEKWATFLGNAPPEEQTNASNVARKVIFPEVAHKVAAEIVSTATKQATCPEIAQKRRKCLAITATRRVIFLVTAPQAAVAEDADVVADVEVVSASVEKF